MFEKPADLQSGSAIEVVSNWYIDNIVKDLNGVSVMFVPSHNCFKSSKPVGGYFADSYTDVKELKSLICVFGGYGFDRLDMMIKEQIAALLNCIDTALRANREALEAIAGSLNSSDRIERDQSLRQILDSETLVGFCVQAGQAIAFRRILVEAVGTVLEEKAPLIFSLLSGTSKHLPDEIPEKIEISRLRKISHSIGGVVGHDLGWIHSVMEEIGAAYDSSWSLLPYLCAAFMVSALWSTTSHDVNTGGFNNNMHCLARSHIVPKLIFLDQLCNLSPYLPRSTLETHLPYAILRSLYLQHYGTSKPLPTMELPFQSPKHSPLISLAHLSPSIRQNHGDLTPVSATYDSGYFSSSTQRQEETIDKKQRNTRRSGPLEYSSCRKVKFVDGSSSTSQGPSPLPRFAVSRSGPLLYK